MPIIKSAKKRVRVAARATGRNARTKRALRSAVRSFTTKTSGDSLKQAQSALDTAVKKGLLHKNKAARKKAQLAAQAKAAGVKLTAKAKAAKPAATNKAKPSKPTTPKKSTPVKKPATKAKKTK